MSSLMSPWSRKLPRSLLIHLLIWVSSRNLADATQVARKHRNQADASRSAATPCDLVFSCIDCLQVTGCAWCSVGASGNCVQESDRDLLCSITTSRSLITQIPAGQICPAALFSGRATLPRKELLRSQGGFASSGRTEVEAQYYMGTFKNDESRSYVHKNLPDALKL